MKQLLVTLVAVLGLATNADALVIQELIDDFSDPALPTHKSLPGTSRAISAPGAGGSVVALGGGTDVAADRGLYGRAEAGLVPAASVAGDASLAFALDPSESTTIDWDLGGLDLTPYPVIVLAGLANTGAMPVMLSVALWQDDMMVDSQNLTLGVGDTADVSLLAMGAPTTFLGLEITNLTGDSPFIGVADQVVANPEPGTMALIGLGVLGGAMGYRRRRKDDEVTPTAAA